VALAALAAGSDLFGLYCISFNPFLGRPEAKLQNYLGIRFFA
jgi:hypothetical protein